MTLSPVSSTHGPSPLADTGAKSPAPADPLASKDVFLQLLVTQLKYQDPESPADGTQFVTQLAQFSQLEDSTQMRDDLDAIRQALASASSHTPAGNTTSSGSSATLPNS